MALVIAVLGFVLLALVLLGAVKALWAMLPYLLGAMALLGIILYLSGKDEPPDK